MSPVVFLDTNVPIYATGSAHPLKEPCKHVLVLASQSASSFVTDAEVMQELLHRYLGVRRWAGGRNVFRHFSDLMQGRIVAVEANDVEGAAQLAETHANLGARDLLHLVVMRRLRVRHIASADTGFDGVPGVERLDPAQWESWRHLVLA